MNRAAHDAAHLSDVARKAALHGDWRTVGNCSARILRSKADDPEGHFLAGLAKRGAGHRPGAVRAFERALQLDASRYDAAIELASQYHLLDRHADSLRLLTTYEPQLGNSPLYLDMAGTTYSRLGLHERAREMYERANRLQPEVDLFQANLAACCVYLGRIDQARHIYERLLKRFPTHQRNHYELSRLQTANDSVHVEQMKEVLHVTNLAPEKNIFLYYAIGKELEDLERWDEAFDYYEMAGNAAASVSNYDVSADLELIETVLRVCTSGWLAAGPAPRPATAATGTPIFIVGLPRTGTTLTDRILSSHSMVESAGETFFMQVAILRESGLNVRQGMTAAVVEAAAGRNMERIAQDYLQAVSYRLSGRPMFIDKFPENFLHLGFIAKALPQARIVHLLRNPMDTCFAQYKQSFFRYAYRLDDLGRYHVAYNRLLRHWRDVLGERLIELQYELLVTDQERQTRVLLDRLGLEFEPACLEFENNVTPAATASAVQVRERMHTRSIGKWKHFESHLRPLKERLEEAGIAVS